MREREAVPRINDRDHVDTILANMANAAGDRRRRGRAGAAGGQEADAAVKVDDHDRLIVRQVCIKAATELVASGKIDVSALLTTSARMEAWITDELTSIPIQAAPTPAAPPAPDRPVAAPGAYPPCPLCGADLKRKTGTSRAGNRYDMVACTNRDCSYIMPSTLSWTPGSPG